jgi:RNase_H superfamily
MKRTLVEFLSPCKRTRSKKQWIFATQLKNYLLNDSLVDWIQLYRKKQVGVKRNETFLPFKSYLFEQGDRFELKIIQQIKNIVGKENYIQIADSLSKAKSKALFSQTVDAINRKVPIILSGVLRSDTENLYGISDLIIRNDWIQKIIPTYTAKDSFYRIIDIKFSTIPLSSDQNRILNQNRYPAYKGQVFVYNKILTEIQGFDSGEAFILGRGWTSSSRGKDIHVRDPFDRLGRVDFFNSDSKFVDKSNEAIKWLRDLQKNGSTWIPGQDKNMYPNLSIFNDCVSEKKEIAEEIADVTLLWSVGYKNREIALEQGILSWKDNRCNATSLGIKSPLRKKIIDRMIQINSDTTDLDILHDKLTKRILFSKNVKLFYVDFEFLGEFSVDRDVPLITVIGVGCVNDDGLWCYKSFHVKTLTKVSELDMINKFLEFVVCLKNYTFVHWSGAEPTQWKAALKRHKLEKVKIQWFDLLEYFKKHGIVVKNCFSFGLKEIALAMHNRKMISTVWDTENPYTNGMCAMFLTEKNGFVDQKLIDYNEMDCFVLKQIVDYLGRKIEQV